MSLGLRGAQAPPSAPFSTGRIAAMTSPRFARGEVKAVASADRGRVWIDRAIAEAARFIAGLRSALPPTARHEVPKS